jgi:uncharacterized protein (DUF3084 family)
MARKSSPPSGERKPSTAAALRAEELAARAQELQQTAERIHARAEQLHESVDRIHGDAKRMRVSAQNANRGKLESRARNKPNR